jgi:hypothetical protein
MTDESPPNDPTTGRVKVDSDDEDESMITPAMEAAIGQPGEPVVIPISRELVRRMAEAIEEEDPALLASLEDEDSHAEVPPWAIYIHYGRYRPARLPDAPRRGLMAADELTLLTPIHIGDVLTVVPHIADIRERIGGRVGHSLFVEHEWTYTNQHGEDVARTRRTVTFFKDKHSGE